MFVQDTCEAAACCNGLKASLVKFELRITGLHMSICMACEARLLGCGASAAVVLRCRDWVAVQAMQPPDLGEHHVHGMRKAYAHPKPAQHSLQCS
jgi:hypothetical protein